MSVTNNIFVGGDAEAALGRYSFTMSARSGDEILYVFSPFIYDRVKRITTSEESSGVVAYYFYENGEESSSGKWLGAVRMSTKSDETYDVSVALITQGRFYASFDCVVSAKDAQTAIQKLDAQTGQFAAQFGRGRKMNRKSRKGARKSNRKPKGIRRK